MSPEEQRAREVARRQSDPEYSWDVGVQGVASAQIGAEIASQVYQHFGQDPRRDLGLRYSLFGTDTWEHMRKHGHLSEKTLANLSNYYEMEPRPLAWSHPPSNVRAFRDNENQGNYQGLAR